MVHVSSGDRAVAERMIVVGNGRQPRRGASRQIAGRTLHNVPAIVPTLLNDINLLPRGLSDVSEEEPPIATIKGETPWIAQPVGPDLPARAGGSQERVIPWDSIRQSPVHVDAPHFAEERAQILPVVLRIPGPP